MNYRYISPDEYNSFELTFRTLSIISKRINYFLIKAKNIERIFYD